LHEITTIQYPCKCETRNITQQFIHNQPSKQRLMRGRSE